MFKNRKVTVIIPALNEAPSIGLVISGLFALEVCSCCHSSAHMDSGQSPELEKHGSEKSIVGRNTRSEQAVMKLSRADNYCGSQCCNNCDQSLVQLVDEVIVGDNGSTDDTARIARACGAIVVAAPQRGYGSACLAALSAPVEMDLVAFVDGDHSVVPEELHSLLEPLTEGADLVIGSRTLGNCARGALSIPQRLGNRLASALMELLWGGQVTDLGPFRATTHHALKQMQMSDKRFGWTVEMQIRSLQLSHKVVEIPVTTRARIGKSKIGGTVKGVIGASHGILGMIARLYWRQVKAQLSERLQLAARVGRKKNEVELTSISKHRRPL